MALLSSIGSIPFKGRMEEGSQDHGQGERHCCREEGLCHQGCVRWVDESRGERMQGGWRATRAEEVHETETEVAWVVLLLL
jgi:hypothetical protein